LNRLDPALDSRLPSYLRLSELLRSRIFTGTYKCGEFMPPERVLALEHGVSRVTVRQAIDTLKQEGILAPEHGRGTRIVASPSDGRAGQNRFNLAALVLYGIARDGSAGILGGCQEVMAGNGRHLILCETPREASKRAATEAAHLRSLIDKGIPGIIVYPTSTNRELLEEAVFKGIKVVQIDRYLAGLECDYVGVDNEGAALQMVSHLQSEGHSRIAFLTIWPEPSTCKERLKGYMAGLSEGVTSAPDTDLIAYCDTNIPVSASVETAVERWMALPDPPSAIFAANDRLAIQVMQILQRTGKRVPAEVAVVGFDNENLAGFVSPPLTTVEQPFRALGETSARMLLERMSGEYSGIPRRVLLPTRLVVRSSCGGRKQALSRAAARPGCLPTETVGTR
jgi:LacI family transcriptional regulator